MNLLEIIIFSCIFSLMAKGIYHEIASQKATTRELRESKRKLQEQTTFSSCRQSEINNTIFHSCKGNNTDDSILLISEKN